MMKKREKKQESWEYFVSGMSSGGLSAERGDRYSPGSIQYVHVVNMKAGILSAQESWFREELNAPASYSA